MATDVRKHAGFAAGEKPSRQAFNDLSLTVNDIVPVSGDSERIGLPALLTGQSSLYTPTAAKPLWVWQQDTEHLWRYNGSNWRDYGAGATGYFAAGTGLSLPANQDYGVGQFNITENIFVNGALVVSAGTPNGLTFNVAGFVTLHILFYIPMAGGGALRLGRVFEGAGESARMDAVPSNVSDRFSLSYATRVSAGQLLTFGWRQESSLTINGCTCTVKGTFVPQ